MKTDKSENPKWNSWQQHLDHALKNLPEKTAPSHLLSNVMAEIRARETRGAFGQPQPFKDSWLRVGGFVFALSVVAYLSFVGGKIYEDDFMPVFKLAGSACRTVLGSLADVLGEFPVGMGDETIRFLIPVLVFVILAMYLTCIGVGTFIYRTVRR